MPNDPQTDLRLKPPCSRQDALAVLARLRDAGHVAYFAGGCVRDMLLGLTPKDYDIATDAPPPRVRQLFPSTQAVGAAFGVILVRHQKSVIEVATFRADGHYADGRRPQTIRYTTAQEDAQRRDFTINGLFFDPLENRVIDYVDGQADIKAHRLRAIGNPLDRFSEDHLRLLRAVRFAARFNFTIDPATQDAIRQSAARLKSIVPERIGDELRLMLTSPTRHLAWRMLWNLNLAREIFRFLPVPDHFSFSESRSLFLATDAAAPIPFGLALAAIALDIRHQSSPDVDPLDLLTKKEAQKSVAAMRTALKISNEESDLMHDVLTALHPLLGAQPPTLATRRRFLAMQSAPLSRQLLAAMRTLGLHPDRIAALEFELAQLDHQTHAPAPLLTGDHLTAAGLTPGPAFKQILDAVYDAQLENIITTTEEALTLALKLNAHR